MTLSLHRPAIRAYALAAAVVVLDQLSKFWVLDILHLAERRQIVLLPIFKLTLVWNQGVSFGLFRANHDVMRWALVAFAVVVVAALVVWTWRQTRLIMAIALGLIIGGALGNNLIDRVRFGAVVDFLDFSPIFPWVFNVADSAITIGVAILLYDAFRRPAKDEPAPAP